MLREGERRGVHRALGIRGGNEWGSLDGEEVRGRKDREMGLHGGNVANVRFLKGVAGVYGPGEHLWWLWIDHGIPMLRGKLLRVFHAVTRGRGKAVKA